ncbi:hypothetical protein LAZ67_1001071 [Cordylochernes scorpioides]|uniref:Uncharacterized protein n=1 Tax=Cordylochernes scorpioides TaxID=51811 RepID=A0ABY6JV62_9ARAC|nr:hypothetical protein LAZ67_1001071 [Cordylochernes scorpioides]
MKLFPRRDRGNEKIEDSQIMTDQVSRSTQFHRFGEKSLASSALSYCFNSIKPYQEIVLGLRGAEDEEKFGLSAQPPFTIMLTKEIIIQSLWEKKAQLGRIHSGKRKVKMELFPRKYRIPRYTMTNKTRRIIQFHSFGEASELAFSAVCYFRSETSNGRVEVSLLVAKASITSEKIVLFQDLSCGKLSYCYNIINSQWNRCN